MPDLEVTLARALKIYWSLLWRSALVWIVVGCAVAIPAYLQGYLTLPEPETDLAIGPPGLRFIGIGLLAALVAEIWIVRSVLRRAYSDFRIVLEGPPKRLKIEPRL